MELGIIIKKLSTSSGTEYVSSVSPINFTSSKADALTYVVNIECVEDMEDALKEMLSELKIVMLNTGTVKYTVAVYKEAECVGTYTIADHPLNITASLMVAKLNGDEVDILKHIPECLESVVVSTVSEPVFKIGDSKDKGSMPKPSTKESSSLVKNIIEAINEKTKATISKPKESLKDYVCNKALKEELDEIVDFFKNAEEYSSKGIHAPKGILFKGIPGTGKTYAAKCIAGSVNAYFMTCTASSLQGIYVGSGAQNIRDLFEGAKHLRSASEKGIIIFIDELDSLGSRENSNNGASDETSRTLNQLLAEMSGFEDEEGILVLAATNYENRLDDALLRSGRFGRQITIDVPTDLERANIIKYYLNRIKLPLKDTDIDEVTALTSSLTPADIKEIINEAGILAIRQKLSNLTLDCINEAINKTITKNVRKPDSPELNYEEIAGHEMGHVLAEVIYCKTLPIKVTNYSYGDAGGFTQSQFRLAGIASKEDLLNEIKILVGGRAAEQVLFHKISTGASNDLFKAKRLIKQFFEDYNFESFTVKEIDQTVEDTLNKIYKDVVTDFSSKDNLELLKNLTNELKENRIMYAKDITLITGMVTMLTKEGEIL